MDRYRKRKMDIHLDIERNYTDRYLDTERDRLLARYIGRHINKIAGRHIPNTGLKATILGE